MCRVLILAATAVVLLTAPALAADPSQCNGNDIKGQWTLVSHDTIHDLVLQCEVAVHTRPRLVGTCQHGTFPATRIGAGSVLRVSRDCRVEGTFEHEHRISGRMTLDRQSVVGGLFETITINDRPTEDGDYSSMFIMNKLPR